MEVEGGGVGVGGKGISSSVPAHGTSQELHHQEIRVYSYSSCWCHMKCDPNTHTQEEYKRRQPEDSESQLKEQELQATEGKQQPRLHLTKNGSKMHLLFSIVSLSLFSLSLARIASHCKKWQSHCEEYVARRTSCCDVLKEEHSTPVHSGIYPIRNGQFGFLNARCDMDADNGGWTVILRRVNNNTHFDRDFSDYEEGFGSLEGNFWYGLRTLRRLTSNGGYEMRLDMYEKENDNSSSIYITYSNFKVEHDNYTLTIEDYKGSDSRATNRLEQFNGQAFSALENSNDRNPCVGLLKVGWWYVLEEELCYAPIDQEDGIILTRPFHQLSYQTSDKGTERFAKYEMKIRPLSCRQQESTA